MEHIRQAVERAKEAGSANLQPQEQQGSAQQQPQARSDEGATGTAQSWAKEVALNDAHLESKRIIAHDITDPRSRSFDMLRTQVLQSMDQKSWQLLGITSPTAGCGKSVIAVNLALSIARQSERSVVLVDMDLQKPQIADTLGLKCDQGLLGALEGRTSLSNAFIRARIRNEQFLVLPCEASTLSSSELIASRTMAGILQEIKRHFKASIVILDLPPILTSDDVISILPQIDCVLFVAAGGTSTAQEIKECNKHLESASIVRVVLNKAADANPAYYYSYSQSAKNSKSRTNMKRKRA
jgi:protein-tyrosine kinase